MCIFLPELIYEYKTCNNIKANKHEYLLTGREGPSGFTQQSRNWLLLCFVQYQALCPITSCKCSNLNATHKLKIIKKIDLDSALKSHI